MKITAATKTARYGLRIGRSRTLIAVDSLEAARAAYDAAFTAAQYRGRTLRGGEVYDLSSAEPAVCARVSQNGRIWPLGQWSAGAEPLA